MPVDQGAADWCEYHPPSGNSETHTKLGADARPFAFSLRENSVTRYAFLTISGHISHGHLEEETMRAKAMRPVDVSTQGNSGLGRAFAVAIVFTGGMYAIATTLIGMV